MVSGRQSTNGLSNEPQKVQQKTSLSEMDLGPITPKKTILMEVINK